MKDLIFTFLCFLTISAISQEYRFPSDLKDKDYCHGKIIVKFKDDYRSIAPTAFVSNQQLVNIANEFELSDVRKNFPSSKPLLNQFNDRGQKLTDLSLYYELIFSPEKNIQKLAFLLEKSGLFQVIQPRYVNKPMAEPDDPQVGQQYHHALIKSFEAWDVEEGDSTVLIGITDAGIQFDHDDLGNWQFNYSDPENGIDDDGNGYIDDIAGWNTATNTNDPTATLSPHGMFTTGLSNATVNNGIGIAGNANQCRFVPIRIDDADGFSYGYEGIVYAADRGCQIINASWGNTFFNPMALDVVNYATINKGSLIIAASGNSGLNEIYYPASYPGVMSVGATGPTDAIWPESTFGPFVDIVAPGELLRSTWPFNGYDISSGTSFSSPLVAGAAALVKSYFPEYTGQQIAERLRVTADTSLFSLSENDTVKGFMGAGRLNMLRALTDPEIPSIRLLNEAFTDNNDNVFVIGDTVRLAGELFNYLADAQNLSVAFSCTSPYIEVINATVNPGLLTGSSSIELEEGALAFRILEGCPYNLDIALRLDYSDDLYHGFEYLTLRVNKDYVNLSSNELSATVTSNGNIGYNSDYAAEGIGITFANSQSLIFSSTLMLGTSANATADNAYASVIPGYDKDFVRVSGAEFTGSGNEVSSSFFTDSASTQRVTVSQRVISAEGDDNFLRYVFTFQNSGVEIIEGLHTGIFTDWEIGDDPGNNNAEYDQENKLNYAYTADGNYVGWALLSDLSAHAYNFNNDGSNGSVTLYDGFSDSEKFDAMSGAISRVSAAGEISALLGTEAISLEPGEIKSIRFALVAGNSLEELQQAAEQAQFEDLVEQLGLALVTVDAGCSQDDGFIQLFTEPVDGTTMRLVNSNSDVLEETQDIFEFEFYGLSTGNYTLEFDFINSGVYVYPFSIEGSPAVDFSISASNTILVLPIAEVEFMANSAENLTYFWDFADGSTSEEQNPVHQFTQTGTFVVSCIASNGTCNDTSFIEILVDNTVGYAQGIEKSFIQVMPNPANQFTQITSSLDDEFISITVYALNGKKLSETKVSGNSAYLETLHLTDGLYMVFVETSKGIQIEKLLVQH